MKNRLTNKRFISVFEYGLMSADSKAIESDNVVHIPEAAFDYLEKCCLCDNSESRFINLKVKHGMKVLQLKNYAGVVFCPDGTQIEVLPKVAKLNDDENSKELARKSLLMMMKSLKQFRHIETEFASIEKQRMPLMEVFISQFLMSVNYLIKKGIKSDYVRTQKNNAFLKGKLIHSKQLKHNFVNKQKFYIEFDEYIVNRAENRLLHSALVKIAGYTQRTKNKKLLQELLLAFDAVPICKCYKQDFSQINIQRGMKYYDAPINWARLILEGFSPQSMKGAHNAYSLLFPMEAVFESFVAKYLKSKLSKLVTLTTQIQSKKLVTYNEKGYFKLKPDIHITTPHSKALVLDTTWLLIGQNASQGKDKFGLSQSDFYQMLGYGFNYLNSEGELVLIYPKTEIFTKPFKYSFNFDDSERLKLRVMPFDISPNCKERIDLQLII